VKIPNKITTEKSIDLPQELFYEESQLILSGLWAKYDKNARAALYLFKSDKFGASQRVFTSINLRLTVSLGISVDFSHAGNPKSKESLRIYELLLKISDLWFSFEHLIETCKKHPSNFNFVKKNTNSKFNVLEDWLSSEPEFSRIVVHCREIFKELNIEPSYFALREKTINEIHSKLPDGGSKKEIDRLNKLLQNKSYEQIHFVHLSALMYATRNFYVHNGAVSKIGHPNYKFLEFVYDTLVLYVIYLANAYAEGLIKKSESGKS
jgi:hypothetical protein